MVHYKKPSKPVPVTLQFGREPFYEFGYGDEWFLAPDDTPDFSVHGDAYITLDCSGVSVEIPGINQYHGDLPDSENATVDVGYVAAMWAYNYLPDDGVGFKSLNLRGQVDGWTYAAPVDYETQLDSKREDWHQSITPEHKFCAHPKKYLMYSVNNDYAQSKFASVQRYRKIVWYIYSIETGIFTDLLAMYNELLARTPSLASFEPLEPTITGVTSALLGTKHYMDVSGMISKIPEPKLRTP